MDRGKDRSMRSKILVPLDGSKVAEAALDQAKKMASSDGVELRLIQAWDHPEKNPESPGERWNKVREERLAYLRKLSNALTADGLTVSNALLEQSPVESILSVANDENVDLIVMTSHGRSGLSRLVLGSVAEEVVRKAPCPVLILGRDYLEKLDRIAKA
jgi:nucleotide-binding universal stress UspA family protein